MCWPFKKSLRLWLASYFPGLQASIIGKVSTNSDPTVLSRFASKVLEEP